MPAFLHTPMGTMVPPITLRSHDPPLVSRLARHPHTKLSPACVGRAFMRGAADGENLPASRSGHLRACSRACAAHCASRLAPIFAMGGSTGSSEGAKSVGVQRIARPYRRRLVDRCQTLSTNVIWMNNQRGRSLPCWGGAGELCNASSVIPVMIFAIIALGARLAHMFAALLSCKREAPRSCASDCATNPDCPTKPTERLICRASMTSGGTTWSTECMRHACYDTGLQTLELLRFLSGSHIGPPRRFNHV